MGWLRSGLSRRFAALMGLLALGPVLFLSWRMMRSTTQGVQDAVLELQSKLAEKTAERVEGGIEAIDGRLRFAMLALQARMDWPDKQALLKRLVESEAGIASVALLRREGGAVFEVLNPELANAPATLDPAAARAALNRALEAGGKTADIVGGKRGPMLLLHYPFASGVFARVVVPLSQVASRVAEERVGGTGFAVLIDRQGRALAAPEGKSLAGLDKWPITKSALSGGTLGSSEFTDLTGVELVGAYAPVPSIGGAVLILQRREEAYLAAAQARKAAATAVLVVIAGSLLAAALLARALTAPVLKLITAAEAVARGDFLTRVEINTGDELQALAETFNKMTAQLRSYSVLQVDRLIAEQRKTEAILFSIDDGILMADKEGRILLANRRAREIFELPAGADLEGKPMTQALPAGPLRDAVLAATPEAFKEVDLSTEKTRRFIRASSRPVVSQGRAEQGGTVYALRDVTLERELDAMKDDFLHYITHDLRNPLGSAMGFIDVLMKGTAGVLNPDQTSIVSSIKRSTTRLMGMINNILDIAKMESGRMRVSLKDVSLAGIASRAIDTLEQLAKGKDITVKLDCAEEFTVQADNDMLERVWINLLGNAIKYTPKGGTVTLSVADDGGSLKCCVADTGEGIPPEYIERVFEKFEQVGGKKRGGTGLGLTITRAFVEAHLGRIWVESVVNQGSQFYFTVPKNLVTDADGAARIAAGAA